MSNHPRAAKVAITPAESAWLAEKLHHLPRPLLAIHPGAGWETKRWPAEKFAEIARRFAGAVVVVGSASERQLAAGVVDVAGSPHKPVLNLTGETSLKQLAALLGAADVVVSNDSGPMHLAAAMGTPVVALFGPSDPRRYGPLIAEARVLRVDLPCAPCGQVRLPPERCRGHVPDCMDGISVAMVVAAADQLLHSASRQAPGDSP
jgi:lipopolysaccharide heptosyltransferase II